MPDGMGAVVLWNPAAHAMSTLWSFVDSPLVAGLAPPVYFVDFVDFAHPAGPAPPPDGSACILCRLCRLCTPRRSGAPARRLRLSTLHPPQVRLRGEAKKLRDHGAAGQTDHFGLCHIGSGRGSLHGGRVERLRMAARRLPRNHTHELVKKAGAPDWSVGGTGGLTSP